MAIVDEHYDNPPPLRLDVFADPTWKPVYSEDSIQEAPVNQGGSVANVEYGLISLSAFITKFQTPWSS